MSGNEVPSGARPKLSEAELYRIAFEGSTDAIVIFNGTDGLILEANASALEMYGYDLSAIRRLTVDHLCAPVAAAAANALDGEASGVVPLFERHRRADGSEFPVDVSIGTTEAGGQPLSVMVVRDVTERRTMERELRRQRLHEQLQGTHRMASLGRLAAGVAHEINNPLTFIIGHADLVRSHLEGLSTSDGSASQTSADAVVNEAVPLLDTIREGVRRIQAIVKDLTTFSRGETPQRSVLRLEPLANTVGRLVANELRDRATLVTDYSETLPVEANEGELGQVILNLLTNAAQAIPEGGVDDNRVTVRTRMLDASHVLLEVSDTGCGIPHEHLHRIFDPFFTSQSMAVKSGMGLAVCHGIVTGLGGELSVESREGHGSTFRITLPTSHLQPT